MFAVAQICCRREGHIAKFGEARVFISRRFVIHVHSIYEQTSASIECTDVNPTCGKLTRGKVFSCHHCSSHEIEKERILRGRLEYDHT